MTDLPFDGSPLDEATVNGLKCASTTGSACCRSRRVVAEPVHLANETKDKNHALLQAST